ncbi:MAG TPA: ABC transporter substrate-binding protein [Dermatophilaceae bacterium]
MPTRRCRVAVALGVGVILATASCSVSVASDVKPTSASPRVAGASLSILRLGPVAAWDPQRLALGADMAFAGRVFERTLTAWAPASHPDTMPDLSPDLATDTGTATVAGSRWSFTLRGDATWQDGLPVTCADVRYGISRTFATTQITGGSTDALALLDVPRNTDGSSTYLGPYLKTGQAGFDKAVTCAGHTITFRLARSVANFNQVVALPAFGPVRADKDRGAKSATEIFSNGPYMLKTAWTPNTGATFVRNPHWDVATDPIRKARPAQIVYEEGVPVETAISTIMSNAGSNSFEVTGDSAPPVLQHNIVSTQAVKALSTNPRAPFVDYLLPNFSRPTMANLKVRQALALSTNREAYVTALGGDTAAEATYAMINKSLSAYHDFNPLDVPPRGDAARARSLLVASGLALPVRITVAYRSGTIADKAMAALQQGWQDAGFSVTLEGLENDYFATIAAVQNSRRYDVMWAVGSAQLPSGSSVIPPLFDSRLNLTAGSSGQDYGRFADPAFNAKIDAAAKIADASRREKAWGDLDLQLAAQVAAIALTNQRYMFVHGAGVRNYIDNPALAATVDLATVDLDTAASR